MESINAGLVVVGMILTAWAILVGLTLLSDAIVRRRQQNRDELAEWRRKVDAMRRLQDEDGAA